MNEMNIKVRLSNAPHSTQYDISRLDFNGGNQVEGGDIWYSDVNGVPDDGDFELMSRNAHLHLLVKIYSDSTKSDGHRKFTVLRKLS